MRNVLSSQSFAGAIVALAVVAAFSAGQAAQSAHLPLDSQDRAAFGNEVTFTPSGYTPPGIVNIVGQVLASQNQAGFGDAITFTASGYTPPGIVKLVRQPLASLNQAGFGDAITFTASDYTPSGITNHSTIKVVVAP